MKIINIKKKIDVKKYRKIIAGGDCMLYKKKWTLKHFGKIKENKVGAQIGISPEISQILKNRDIITEKDAEIFMNPSLDYLRDPFLMKDMQKGVDRIKKAI